MYDSSVKEPSGVEYGDAYQFGNFDQCLSAFQSHGEVAETKRPVVHGFTGPEFNPQYCLAEVSIEGYRVDILSSRDLRYKVIKLMNFNLPLPLIISV